MAKQEYLDYKPPVFLDQDRHSNQRRHTIFATQTRCFKAYLLALYRETPPTEAYEARFGEVPRDRLLHHTPLDAGRGFGRTREVFTGSEPPSAAGLAVEPGTNYPRQLSTDRKPRATAATLNSSS